MKKKLAIIGTITLLGVGGFTMFNLNNPDWRTNTIFATTRDKQLAWLKEHEKQIVAWVHSRYPKVETIQFDWKTLEVGPVSNGVMNIGYNLSVEGTFNDIPETIIFVDFRMETADSIPKMSQIRMNQPPSIKKDDGGVYDYE
jgi:lipoprotein